MNTCFNQLSYLFSIFLIRSSRFVIALITSFLFHFQIPFSSNVLFPFRLDYLFLCRTRLSLVCSNIVAVMALCTTFLQCCNHLIDFENFPDLFPHLCQLPKLTNSFIFSIGFIGNIILNACTLHYIIVNINEFGLSPCFISLWIRN